MAYDEALAVRIRDELQGEPGLTEKKMFGGLAFLIDGHLVASASGQGGMLLRVPPAETSSLLQESGVNRFEMRGRPMDGWLHVDADAVADEQSLRRWLSLGTAYARSLPPK